MKKTLRGQVMAARMAITAEEARQHAHALARHLAGAALPPAPAVVAGYMPIRGEIDVLPALARLAAGGYDLALPDIGKDGLVFRRWRHEDALMKGRYGIPVPPSSAPALTPEVLILPLVAFDAGGGRLGYGAGYYDRALRELRRAGKVLALGAAYAAQEVAVLPHDDHDERLDAVITERGLRWFKEE